MEYIFLVFSTDSNSKEDSEAAMKDLLEKYNSRAEKIGLKNFIISTSSYHACDTLGNMECFTTMIQREVRCNSFSLPLFKLYNVLLHQPEKPPPPPRDVIDRAIAEGIIDGQGISDTVVKKKTSKTKRRHSLKQGSLAMTIAAQQKVVQKKEHGSPKKFFRF